MRNLFFLLSLVVFMFLFFSCDAESSRVKEISISNQHAQKTKNTNAPSKAKIFVAVSTMISPMETFNLYEELIG
ncbi:MAG: hypothetical protein HYV28_12540 [Ignavibacteriales bacterium]|nr:hypothetical protein [Ignavibacteriales bacterium]